MESPESSIGFKQYGLMLKRRWLPASAVFVSVLVFTSLAVFLLKPTYVAQGIIRFKRGTTTSSLTELGENIGQLDPIVEQNNPLQTEIVVIRSAPIVQKTIARLNLRDKQGAPLEPEKFLKQLRVENLLETDVLQVSYIGKDPEEITVIVNTLITHYLESNLAGNRVEATTVRQFIEKQLPRAEATTRQVEAALRRFKERNKVVDLQEEANSKELAIADLQKQITQAQAELTDVNAQSTKLRNELGIDLQKAKAATALSQSPGVQEVLREFQQVESQLAVEQTRFQGTHPSIAALKRREAYLRALLQKRVKQVLGGQKQVPDKNLQISEFEQDLTEELVKSEGRRLGLASQVAALSNAQAAYSQRVNVLPRLEQEQRELERKLEAAQSSYESLLKQLQEARVAENQNAGNATVIEAAQVPKKPVAPRKLLYLVAGGLLGSLLSIAAALILESRDRSIKTVAEARELLGLNLLGVIPTLKGSKKTARRHRASERCTPEIVVRHSPRSPFSAAYRMLWAKLKFLNSKNELKVIVVTSSVPREGKSTVSANLAATMAQLGQRTLLVDADMYCPIQHRIWGLHNEMGFSNVLVGQVEFKEAVKTAMLNLDVLTAGVEPCDPLALLDSQQMTSLVKIFSASYDFVIIDTPTLTVEADTLILGQRADGVLLVVRPGVVDAASAIFTKEFLEQSGQNVLGQVVNGVIPDNEPHRYYYSTQEDYTEESPTTDQTIPQFRGEKDFSPPRLGG